MGKKLYELKYEYVLKVVTIFDCIVTMNQNVESYLEDYYLYETVIDNNQVNKFYMFVRN